MSYDMHIGDESFSYTYNVAPMWYAAIPNKGIRAHYNLSGKRAIKPLLRIYNYMVTHYDKCIEMEPDNDWGSYEGALKFVTKLITASLRNPDEIWEGD